jgi:ADP-dependent NAD(P)H-hydrate dehydratase
MSGVETLDAALLRRFPLPAHDDASTKDDRGILLIVGGSREVPGAALLAGKSGMRAGAGKLQIATAQSVAVAVAVAMPEARVVAYAEDEAGCIVPADAEDIVQLVARADATVLGSGMEHGASLDRFLDAVLAADCTPLILDAAVLGSLSARAASIRLLNGNAVVLPHVGEMARMLGCDEAEVEADPLAAARRGAETFATMTVMKGRSSFIVAPDGRAFRYEGGGVGLATSGSGDTLAGIVGGLAARGADPLTATLWGVFLHGEAGRRLAGQIGRIGFLAREIAEDIPALLEGR